MELFDALLFSSVRAATPLLLVVLGVLVTERAGVINLGQEGLIIVGAACAFVVTAGTGSPWLGIGAGLLAGVALALLFGLLVLLVGTNQVATGLALTLFGAGLAAVIGTDMSGVSIDGMAALPLPLLDGIPWLGPGLFSQDPVVYLALALVPLAWWLVHGSRIGLRLAAVGHNPAAAHQLGLPVFRIQLAAVLTGGALAGLAGAWLAVAYTPLWSESISAGRGWIALALVVFAGWRVMPALFGAWLFGASSVLHLGLQGLGLEASPQLMSMLPYALTLVVMVMISARRLEWRSDAPRALGQQSMSGG